MTNSKENKTLSIAVIVAVSLGLSKIIDVFTGLFFTRLMPVSEYGVYNTFKTWFDVFNTFSTINILGLVFNQGLVKFADSEYKLSIRELLLCSIGISCALFALLKTIFNIRLSYLHIALIGLLTACVIYEDTWAANERNNMSYKKFAIFVVVQEFLRQVIGCIAVYYCNGKADARILSWVLVEVILVIVLFYNEKHEIKWSTKYWKYALSIALPLLPYSLAPRLISSSSQIIISQKIGETEAGIYSIANSVAGLALLFNTVFIQVLEPWIYRKIKAQRQNETKSTLIFSAACTAIINLCVILVTPEAMRIFAPSSYQDAVDIIPTISMYIFFDYVYSLFAVFEKYYESTNKVALVSIIASIIGCITNFLLITNFGYKYGAYGTILYYVLLVLIHYLNIKPNIKIGKEILTISIGFVTLGIVFKSLYQNIILRFILAGLLVGAFTVLEMKNKTFVSLLTENREQKK